MDFVLEQYSKDIKYSYGFYSKIFTFDLTIIGAKTARCTTGGVLFPDPIPDGVLFSQGKLHKNQPFKEYQSLRLPNAAFNYDLQGTFTIALWVKPFQNLMDKREDTLLSFNKDSANEQNLQIILAYKQSTDTVKIKADLFFPGSTGLITSKTGDFAFKDGWLLIGLSVLYKGTDTSIRLRAKSFNSGGTGQKQQSSRYYISSPEQVDAYVGSYCSYQSEYYQGGFKGTFGKMYIWKKFAETQIDQDPNFENSLLRIGQGKCLGIIPCLICALDPFAQSQFKCQTGNTSPTGPDPYILGSWDFSADDTQFILDTSNNGYHLVRNSPFDIEISDPQIVFGQGMVFEHGMYATAIQVMQLSSYNQLTFEGWIKLNWQYRMSQSSTFDIFRIFDLSTNQDIFCLSFKSNNDGSLQFTFKPSSTFPLSQPFTKDLFAQDKWQYFACIIVKFADKTSSSNFYSQTMIKWVLDDQSNQFNVINLTLFYIDQTQVYEGQLQAFDSANSIQHMQVTKGSFMIRKLTVYKYARLADETFASIEDNCINTDSINILCKFCPSDTQKCIPTCAQNYYLSNEKCTKCHTLCGHCKGPTQNDCVYCNRDPQTNIIYSQIFGNCTCKDGFWWDATTDKCQQCHANCKACFGSSIQHCLDCAIGKYFFPVTTCVASCDDPLVKNSDLNAGFYPTEESNGLKMCAKCHPYCLQCNGSSNTQCQQCQPQYFLLNNTICQDSCPAGTWNNRNISECSQCNETCNECTGGRVDQCISCSNVDQVQQFGTCLDKCYYGYYADSMKVCQKCHLNCQDCATAGNKACPACNPGFFLEYQAFTCESFCKAGTYPDAASSLCMLCHYSCKTCSTGKADSCIQCAKGYLKRGALCATECSGDEFIINNTCTPCNPKCTTCYGINDYECYSCAENPIDGVGYFFYNNTCNNYCPDGQYPDNFDKLCKACPVSCPTCTSRSYCTSCIQGQPFQLNNGQCTKFQCLDSQYLAINPQLTCFNCHPSCATCQGFSQFDCLSCLPQYQLVGQQCLTCNEQPGMMEPVEEGVKNCVEICGDGFNYQQYECDDGNKVDGDGCSSNCRIESGFNCSGGSELTPDVCFDTKKPSFIIALINAKNQIYLQFDEEVKLTDDLTDKQLQIIIEDELGSNIDCNWYLTEESKQTVDLQIITLDLTIKQTLKGGGKEQVKISFLNETIFVDQQGNGLNLDTQIGKLNAFEYIDPVTKANLENAGSTSMLATAGAMMLNLAISLVFGGSISAMWTMVNTIQLISLLPLTAVQYPQNVRIVFEKMLSTHGEVSFIPNVIYDYGLNRTNANSSFEMEEARNARFKEYGWDSSNFLKLSGRKILIWAALILLYPVVYYLRKKYSDKHKFCEIWRSINQKYEYTLLLRGFIMSYCSMFLAASLNLFKLSFQSLENTITSFVCITGALLLVYLPIQIMNILQSNYSRVKTEKFMLQYSTIIKELDTSRPIRYMYYPVFLLRRAVFAFVLVLFSEQPLNQLIVMSSMALLMLLYILIIRPQKDKLMIGLTAYGEIIMLFMHLISLKFIQNDITDKDKDFYGYLILAVVGSYVAINWVIVIVVTILNMKDSCKIKERVKAELKKKQKLDHEYKKWKKKQQMQREQDQNFDNKKKVEEQIQKQKRNMSTQHTEEISFKPLIKDYQVNVIDVDDLKNQQFGSPNPFYNPRRHHEIESAQRQHDAMNASRQDTYFKQFISQRASFLTQKILSDSEIKQLNKGESITKPNDANSQEMSEKGSINNAQATFMNEDIVDNQSPENNQQQQQDYSELKEEENVSLLDVDEQVNRDSYSHEASYDQDKKSQNEVQQLAKNDYGSYKNLNDDSRKSNSSINHLDKVNELGENSLQPIDEEVLEEDSQIDTENNDMIPQVRRNSVMKQKKKIDKVVNDSLDFEQWN